MAAAMKVLFESLDALLSELTDRKIESVRVSSAVLAETGRRTGRIPHLTSRVIVTATLSDQLWAEWRYWIGRAPAEIGDRGLHLPTRLKERSETALTEIRQQIEARGFRVLDGLIAHDTAAMENYRR